MWSGDGRQERGSCLGVRWLLMRNEGPGVRRVRLPRLEDDGGD